jgi:hypothetical protein
VKHPSELHIRYHFYRLFFFFFCFIASLQLFRAIGFFIYTAFFFQNKPMYPGGIYISP